MRHWLNRRLMRWPIWPLYVLGALVASIHIGLGLADALGADPLNALERALGEWALRFLILSLMVTPLRLWLGVNALRFRRALGLIAFGFAALHLLVFIGLDHDFDWRVLGREIVRRPFITLGMAAFALLLPLALTSNAVAIRMLGGVHWRRLHRLVYVAALLAAFHVIMVKKVWESGPLIYLVVIAALLVLRLKPSQSSRVA